MVHYSLRTNAVGAKAEPQQGSVARQALDKVDGAGCQDGVAPKRKAWQGMEKEGEFRQTCARASAFPYAWMAHRQLTLKGVVLSQRMAKGLRSTVAEQVVAHLDGGNVAVRRGNTCC